MPYCNCEKSRKIVKNYDKMATTPYTPNNILHYMVL